MRFCYADPPYPGLAHKYAKIDPNAAEIDHGALIHRLCDEFPDGWALSTHSPALQFMLALCPPDVRVLAWVKPFCSFKKGVGLAYAWEPVIFRGGRKRTTKQPTVRDWLAANVLIKKGVPGMKPPAFWQWLFEAANLQPTDEFVDLFPGSGAGDRAWAGWRDASRPSQLALVPDVTTADRLATAKTRRGAA